MGYFYPQNPGIGGLDELTPAEEAFLTSLAASVGTTNKLAKWISSNTLGDSLLSDNGTVITSSASIIMPNSFYIGAGASATGEEAVAYGKSANAANDFALAFGSGAFANGYQSTAFGNGASAIGDRTVAIGGGASADGDDSIVAGNGANTSQANSIAFGELATCEGIDSLAIGNNTYSGHNDAIAIGRLATTTAANQFMIGSATANLNTIINGTLSLPGSLKWLGYVSNAGVPTTTQLPADKDVAMHKNTSTGTISLAYNDGGTIRTVALA